MGKTGPLEKGEENQANESGLDSQPIKLPEGCNRSQRPPATHPVGMARIEVTPN